MSEVISAGAASMEGISLAVSLIAVVISIYALWMQRKQGHEVSTQTLIHDQYELCRVLDQLRVEHPEVSHMLALPAQAGNDAWVNYRAFKARVQDMFDDTARQSQAEQSRLYLKEHAVALNVFDIYEQTVFQRKLATAAGDDGRFQVLNDLVTYYQEKMLRNPRLRYHWENGGSDLLEAGTQALYIENVRKRYPDDPVDDKSPIES